MRKWEVPALIPIICSLLYENGDGRFYWAAMFGKD